MEQSNQKYHQADFQNIFENFVDLLSSKVEQIEFSSGLRALKRPYLDNNFCAMGNFLKKKTGQKRRFVALFGKF